MDDETSSRLEDAFLKGVATLVLDSHEGWQYQYDLPDWTQTSIPPGNEKPKTRQVRRVLDVNDV
jgi:hypothetical protein